ncbi:hypothetical protein ACIGO9_30535 [Nocardia asteroides]|uniref:hypothetical protein n=1 Tax=Nocardia asteroides TaxID=1824 RepID=UPI0037CCB082
MPASSARDPRTGGGYQGGGSPQAGFVGKFWPLNNPKVLLDAITGQSYGDCEYSSVAVSRPHRRKPPFID